MSAIGQVWKAPTLRKRIVSIAVVVGAGVSLAHGLLGERLSFATWTLFHALLPCVVYTGGALASGTVRASKSFVLTGIATVVVVTLGFTAVNGFFVLPVWLGLPLNLAIPAVVATLGAADFGGQSVDSE